MAQDLQHSKKRTKIKINQRNMKRFLTRKDLRMKRKQAIYAAISVIVVIALYLVLTRKENRNLNFPSFA